VYFGRSLATVALVGWLRGTVVERRSLIANFPCAALDLQLMGDHLC